MENKKDIGKAFRDRLNHLDKTPSDALWSKIEANLGSKKRKSDAFWLIPVLLISGLFIGGTLFIILNKSTDDSNQKNSLNPDYKNEIGAESKNTEVNSEQTVFVETQNAAQSDSKKESLEKNSSQESISTTNTIYSKPSKAKNLKSRAKKSQSSSKYNNGNIATKKSFSVSKNKKAKKNYAKTNLKKKKNIIPSKTANTTEQTTNDLVDDKSLQPQESQTFDANKAGIEIAKKDSIIVPPTQKQAEKPTEKDSTTTEKEDDFRISVSPYLGLTYYGSFGNQNPLSDQYEATAQKGSVGSTFGIYALGMISKKLGFRIGYGKLNVENSVTIQKNNSSFLDYRNVELEIKQTQNDFNNLFVNDSEVTFNQKISYAEIPVEVYYVWKAEKFGIASAIGVSFLFLSDNELSLKSDSVNEFTIGRAKNLSSNSFTTNLDFIFSYEISKKINLELSPTFKYQFDGYARTNDFKPYILTLQIGISYKF